MATPITRYIDTDTGNAGNGGTSWADAWDKLVTAEAQNRACTTNDEVWTIYYRGTAIDSTAVTWDGWLLDATRYVQVETDYTGGTRNASYPRLQVEADWIYVLSVLDTHVRFVGLQVKNTGSNGSGAISVNVGGTVRVLFSRCLVYDTQGDGIHLSNGSGIYMENCVVVGSEFNGITNTDDETPVGYAYNCISAANGGYGFSVSSYRTFNVKNCYAGGNTGADYYAATNGTMNLTTCYSEDGTRSTPTAAYSTSAGAYFTNVSAGSQDFHIAATSTLVDTGTDLSGDAVFPFTTDFDGDTRVDWSVGPDEYVAAGGGTTGTAATAQEPQALSAAGTALFHITGTGATNQAPQSLAAAGTALLAISGNAITTQAAQSAQAQGTTFFGISGTAATAQAPQAVAGVGTVVQIVTGTAATAQAPQAVTASGTAFFAITGVAATAQAPQSIAASGTALLAITGAVATAQAPQTVSATGTHVYGTAGTAATTQAPQELAAIGTVVNIFTGTAATDQAPQEVAATGTALLAITGSGTTTQAAQELAATGATLFDITGTATTSQAMQALAATGSISTAYYELISITSTITQALATTSMVTQTKAMASTITQALAITSGIEEG